MFNRPDGEARVLALAQPDGWTKVTRSDGTHYFVETPESCIREERKSLLYDWKAEVLKKRSAPENCVMGVFGNGKTHTIHLG